MLFLEVLYGKAEFTYTSLCIAIANLIKPKVPIKPNKPSRQTIQHLCQRWMNIEIILPLDVLSCKGPKVDFIKDDLVRMGNAPESDDTGDDGQCGCC